MSNKLSTANQVIIEALVKKGASTEQLSDTNLHIVRIGSKNHFFVNDMNPAAPYIYGVFATDSHYTDAILSEEGIPLSTNAQTGAHKIMLTDSGYFGSISPKTTDGASDAIRFVDTASRTSKSVKSLAQRILDLFPGASYVSFSLFVDSLSDEFDNSFSVSDITFSLEGFVDFRLYKKGKSKKTTDVIADMILHDI